LWGTLFSIYTEKGNLSSFLPVPAAIGCQ